MDLNSKIDGVKLSIKRFINNPKRLTILYQLVYGALIRGRRTQLKRAGHLRKEYLNVGCGLNFPSGFINLDYYWAQGVDLCWDIRKGIPLGPDTMKGVYTEHCLEHVTFSQCQNVLRDLYRILKPGGTLRVIVPDAGLYLDLYQKEKQGERVQFPYVTEADIKNGFSPIMAVNRIFKEHGHLYVYDFRLLKAMLEKTGFVNIKREKFMNGRDPKLLIDTEHRAVESLYVEAEKPARGQDARGKQDRAPHE